MQDVPIRRRSPPLLLDLSRAALASAVGMACLGNLEPCPGVQKGAEFEIELLDSQASDTDCHEAYGFTAGTLIEGTIADTVGEADCEAGVPGIERLGDWSWTREEDARIIGGHTLEGRYVISKGSCTATLWLILRDEHPLACDAALGDRCSLETRITPVAGKEASCPSICDGHLRVRAQRL